MEQIFFTITAGAGGREPQDIATILCDMYCKWFDKKGFRYEITNKVTGVDDGIETITLKVVGGNVITLCNNEVGIHRFIRISPFDARRRRHTSFVEVSTSKDGVQNNDNLLNWSSIIRSYVTHPYKSVKDHRTGLNTTDIDSVFNGNLDYIANNAT